MHSDRIRSSSLAGEDALLMARDDRASVDGSLEDCAKPETANANLILAFSLICSVNLRYAAWSEGRSSCNLSRTRLSTGAKSLALVSCFLFFNTGESGCAAATEHKPERKEMLMSALILSVKSEYSSSVAGCSCSSFSRTLTRRGASRRSGISDIAVSSAVRMFPMNQRVVA